MTKRRGQCLDNQARDLQSQKLSLTHLILPQKPGHFAKRPFSFPTCRFIGGAYRCFT